MESIRTSPFILAALIVAAVHSFQAQPPPASITVASVVERQIDAIEQLMVDATEAMPEGQLNFSPETLNIPGSDYKGVRSFGAEVKHVAASNYVLWSALTGDKTAELFNNGNGPENIKTKAAVLQFLKDSFALGHKAAATLTTQNMLQVAGAGGSSRLHLATFAVAHAYDHYGQMVEYL